MSGNGPSSAFCCGLLIVLAIGLAVYAGRRSRQRGAAGPADRHRGGPVWTGERPASRARRFTSARDFEEVLSASSPGRIEVEIREADSGPGGWGTYPEGDYRRRAEEYGYTLIAREEGGRPPNYGWMGPGDRWVRMTFRRRPAALPTPDAPVPRQPGPAAELPAADPAQVMDYVDRILGCGGDLGEANAAAKLIFIACPRTDPHRRITSDSQVDALLERPWRWLRDLSAQAEARADRVTVAKLALLCVLWNRLLIPDDPNIQIGALVQAPGEIEAGLYEAGLRAMAELPAYTWLGGELRGQFLVEDSRARVAGALVELRDAGVRVDPDAYRMAVGLVDE